VITFDASVRIGRPLEDAYAYVAEPGNFPHWNSAVEAVRKTSAGDDTGVGSTYVMERTLPTGRAVNGLEIVAHNRQLRSQSARPRGRRRSSTASGSRRTIARPSSASREKQSWDRSAAYWHPWHGGRSSGVSRTTSRP
jgi:hypothetical protein